TRGEFANRLGPTFTVSARADRDHVGVRQFRQKLFHHGRKIEIPDGIVFEGRAHREEHDGRWRNVQFRTDIDPSLRRALGLDRLWKRYPEKEIPIDAAVVLGQVRTGLTEV